MNPKRTNHDSTLPLPKVGMPPRLRDKAEMPGEMRAPWRTEVSPEAPSQADASGRWSLRFAFSLCVLLLGLNIALSALFKNDAPERLAQIEPAGGAGAQPVSERRGSLATYVSPDGGKPVSGPLDHTLIPAMADTPATAGPTPIPTTDKPSS